jgi:hypothetical protein
MTGLSEGTNSSHISNCPISLTSNFTISSNLPHLISCLLPPYIRTEYLCEFPFSPCIYISNSYDSPSFDSPDNVYGSRSSLCEAPHYALSSFPWLIPDMLKYFPEHSSILNWCLPPNVKCQVLHTTWKKQETH